MPSVLARGDYAPSGPTDLRSPCPMVNSLANHGYLPRDGRGVRADELLAGLRAVGLSLPLRSVFTHPLFLEREPMPVPTLLSGLWYRLRHPWSLVLAAFGMRRAGQFDAAGHPCLDLDQIGRHSVVEHDISLTRLDAAQGDFTHPQPDLVAALLAAASADGGATATLDDLVALRRRRIDAQVRDNPDLHYGSQQHIIGSTEIALILRVFGDGARVPRDYLRAFFEQERLPLAEGWRPRRWWPLGLVELVRATMHITKLIGVRVE